MRISRVFLIALALGADALAISCGGDMSSDGTCCCDTKSTQRRYQLKKRTECEGQKDPPAICLPLSASTACG